MGVDLSRSTPSSSSNVFDRIGSESGGLGQGLASGLNDIIVGIGLALESAWSWLTGGPRYDIPENFMPLEESAYAVLEPVKTGVDDALEAARTAEGDMVALQAELAVLLPEIAADVEEARRLAGEARDQLTAAQESNARTQQVVQAAVASGASSAGLAMAMAQEAIVLVDEADLILAEVRALNVLVGEHAASAQSAVTEARQARDDASSSLSSARGVLDQVEDAGEDVQALHTQVLGLHQDTLIKHGEAIGAATDATGALADAVLVQQDITTKHGEVLTKHGEAIRLTASSSASAGMAAMQALMAAESLSETQDAQASTLALHADVIGAHGDAIGKLSNAVQLQEETARLQTIINRQTLTALEVHENLNKWRDDTRTRIGSTTNVSGNPGPWNSVCGGRIYVRSGDDRRRVEWTAPGSWSGLVLFHISWNTATITGDDYFTNHFAYVTEDSRGTWFPSPKNLQYVRQVSVFVEPWWGMTKREFVFQVGGPDGDSFIKTSAYEAPLTMVTWMKNTATGADAPKFEFPVTANYPVSGMAEDMTVTDYDTGQTIPAGSMLFPMGEVIPPDPTPVFPPVVKFTEA